jgi:hypothetical protein
LAEIELEKVARAASGDIRLTYTSVRNRRVIIESAKYSSPERPGENPPKPHHSSAPAHSHLMVNRRTWRELGEICHNVQLCDFDHLAATGADLLNVENRGEP